MEDLSQHCIRHDGDGDDDDDVDDYDDDHFIPKMSKLAADFLMLTESGKIPGRQAFRPSFTVGARCSSHGRRGLSDLSASWFK